MPVAFKVPADTGELKEHTYPRTKVLSRCGPGAANPGEPHDPHQPDPLDRRPGRTGWRGGHARRDAHGPGGGLGSCRDRGGHTAAGLQDHGLRQVQVRPVQAQGQQGHQSAGNQGSALGPIGEDRPARRADPCEPGPTVPDAGPQGADHPAFPRSRDGPQGAGARAPGRDRRAAQRHR